MKYTDPCWCSIATLSVPGNPDHTRLAFIVRRAHGSNWDPFETQSELNYSDSQHAFVSRNQRGSFACVPIISTVYTARTNVTDKKEGGKKSNSPLTCDLRGTGGLPCMHTEEVQTEFMTALSLLFLITSPPISGH